MIFLSKWTNFGTTTKDSILQTFTLLNNQRANWLPFSAGVDSYFLRCTSLWLQNKAGASFSIPVSHFTTPFIRIPMRSPRPTCHFISSQSSLPHSFALNHPLIIQSLLPTRLHATYSTFYSLRFCLHRCPFLCRFS